MITYAASRHNRLATLWPGSGNPLKTGMPTLPCIEVARVKVFGYVEAVEDGLRLATSVHLGRRLPRALARDGLAELRISVNGTDVFEGLFAQSSHIADEVRPEQANAARHNREAELFGGSGYDPNGEGGAPLPCIQVAGTQVYGYVEGFGDRLRLVASVHLDGGDEEIPPELLRGDLVPVRVAVNGIQVFAA